MSLNQLYIFLLFILTGIVIGIVFDIFRIFRRSFKTNDIITYVQDFLFWLVTGCILLFSIFTFNNGELRGYIFVGIILGLILHLLILSKYFIGIFVKIINLLKKIMGYPLHLLLNFTKKYIISPISNLILKIRVKLPKVELKDKKSKKIPINFNKQEGFYKKM